MSTAPFITPLESSRTDAPSGLRIGGDWTLAHYARLETEVLALSGSLAREAEVDLQALGALDTAGAALLVELLGSQRLAELAAHAPGLAAERRALLQTVGNAIAESGQLLPAKRVATWREILGHIGQAVDDLYRQCVALLGFIGLTLSAMLRILLRPGRWRMTSLAAHLEQSGLNAVPIVALLTFLVGAVVAFVGATVLANFGATIFTVDLVAFSFLREFAVLLTAILMAGRTASAFTAQIGSMKANEEIDAIRTLGLDPMELLVVPRVLALLVALPMLRRPAQTGQLAGCPATIHRKCRAGNLSSGVRGQEEHHFAELLGRHKLQRGLFFGQQCARGGLLVRSLPFRQRGDLLLDQRRSHPPWADGIGRDARARVLQCRHFGESHHAMLRRHIGRLVHRRNQSMHRRDVDHAAGSLLLHVGQGRRR